MSEKKRNKSNRTTMRPLGIYPIGISMRMYILNMLHFLMILDDFGVFTINERTYGQTYRRTHGRRDPFIEMQGRI